MTVFERISRRRRKKHLKAFALAETLISMLVLAVMILAIMGTMTLSLRGVVDTGNRESAYNIAVGELDNKEIHVRDENLRYSETIIGNFIAKSHWDPTSDGSYLITANVYWPKNASAADRKVLTLKREVNPSAATNAQRIAN